jgi:hypothetical protein
MPSRLSFRKALSASSPVNNSTNDANNANNASNAHFETSFEMTNNVNGHVPNRTGLSPSATMTAMTNTTTMTVTSPTQTPTKNPTSTSTSTLTMRQQIKASKQRRASTNPNNPNTTRHRSNDQSHNNMNNTLQSRDQFRKFKKYHVRDPLDPVAAGQLVSLITPIRPSTTMDDTITTTNTGKKIPPLTNECLLALRVKSFEFTGNTNTTTTNTTTSTSLFTTTTHSHHSTKNFTINPKSKNKIRYVCITRSTNQILMKRKRGKVLGGDGGLLDTTTIHGRYNDEMDHDWNNDHDPNDDDSNDSNDDDSNDSNEEEDNDNDSNDGYDTLYNPENDNDDDDMMILQKRDEKMKKRIHSSTHASASVASSKKKEKDGTSSSRKKDSVFSVEHSSFPNLVFMAIHSDGTHPDVRKILPLDQLVAIENVMNKNVVQLFFQNGILIEIDFDLKVNGPTFGDGTGSISGHDNSAALASSESVLKKERFLWSLLQIHAILCTSVMERNLSRSDVPVGSTSTAAQYITGASTATTSLPTLTMKNVDRAELQYISTVNGFLSDSPVLCTLLERHRNAITEKSKAIGGSSGGVASGIGEAGGQTGHDATTSSEEKKTAVDEMDGIAYDMIMGNFSNLTLFLTEEEKQDAEEVLNSTFWLEGAKSDSGSVRSGSGGDEGKVNVDEISTAETLTGILQKRMRDLEAETCRRLIAWEDEKYYNSTGNKLQNTRDTMDAISLSVLFTTLDQLDETLEGMEEWLADKVATVKPLTDECREVEEENRQLGFQRKSYTLISAELKRLLNGLQVPENVETILRDPTSKMVYHSNGEIDIVESQAGVEDIYHAGRALKEAFDRVQDENGVHLRGVRNRVEALLALSDSFCENIGNTIIAVMERTIAEINKNDEFDYLSSTHAQIGKAIRTVRDISDYLHFS